MKTKLLLFALLTAASIQAQTSSNSCSEADANTPITQPGVYSIDIINGSEYPIPLCGNNTLEGSLGEWFKYIPDSDSYLTVSTDLTQNEGRDTRIHIYSGTCGALVCEGGDDDSGSVYLSIASVNVTGGETYYIAFDNRWNGDGFDFEIIESDPPTPPAVTFAVSSLTTTGSDRAIVDMNGDHLDDIVSVSNTNINIHEQQTEGGFTSRNIETSYANYTPSWSLSAADYNADGFTDLLYGGGSGVTFMRSNGNGTFTEFSGSEYVFSQRSNFVDINNDGHLDAFVCHDVAPNVYYINDGEGNLTFYQGENSNGGVPSGLGLYDSGGNYGSIWIDYDNDRNLDMFIAKCGGEEARRTNQMHKNNGDGSFSENASEIFLADPMQTWSSAWGDFDNDGDMDVFVGASSGTHKMMRNNLTTDGQGNTTVTFEDVTAASGVYLLSDTGIENATYDFDNDGNLDIASNGNILFGNGDLTFTVHENLISGSNGSFGDLNNDGFIDAFSNGNIYINNGNNNNWISICTIGSEGFSNINGIGARVEIHTPSGIQIRDIRSGEGFRYMSTLNTHFGLGTETTINNLIIYWPSGVVDNIQNPSINQRICVTEGESLSVEDYELEGLTIYPNPVEDILNISTPVSISGKIATVFDLNGKKVLNSKLNTNNLDVSKLQTGFYILRLESEGRVINRKFIKQ
ncbi:Por secretion system C-terminal sorting domain-containing protein [Bizionia echini]|uniref:Por secretion system C-terminal sorting domain-containing protein n=1 Tax=Bizionia echini TaxID=649333 RepID=A0A1I4ZCQ6_9FLAO|nr:FG-GAP-like repeat-containing protein [Bizionia echini]SFN48061.1 Por secretion system C-terminal sorting domain-containing protein [Bizionia echini]